MYYAKSISELISNLCIHSVDQSACKTLWVIIRMLVELESNVCFIIILRTLSSLHSMMVSVVCLYVLLYEDQLSDDPIWFVFMLCSLLYLSQG